MLESVQPVEGLRSQGDGPGEPVDAAWLHLERLLPELEVLEVPLCKELRAYQAVDVVALWSRWESVTARRQAPPFWGFVWPGAALLARSLLDEPSWVRGRRVIDLGCGGGVVAAAARAAGALRVWANDVDPMALRVAQANARLNGMIVEELLGDLTVGPEVLSNGDVLLVSEMFYEGDRASPFLEFLRRCRARGAEVIVADGGRPFAPAFSGASGLELLRAERVPTNLDLEGVSERWVRLGRLIQT